jgi:hypothetical protein
MKEESGDAPFWTGHGYRQIVQKTGRHGIFLDKREHVYIKTTKNPSEWKPCPILEKTEASTFLFHQPPKKIEVSLEIVNPVPPLGEPLF